MNVGDVILTRDPRQGPVSRAIQFGQRLRYGQDSPYVRWNHVAIVSGESFGGRPMITEALMTGVVERVSPYHDPKNYRHVPLHLSAQDKHQVGAFLDAVLAARTRYGWPTIAGLAVYTVTGGKLTIQKAGTAICSGLVCDALTRAGCVFPRPPYSMMPADVAAFFEVGS